MCINTQQHTALGGIDMNLQHKALCALAALALPLSAAGCATERTAQRIDAVPLIARSTVATDTTYGPLGCDWATDQAANVWLSDELVARCDYRVTGARCEEDELCAIQQVRDTGDFTGDGR